MESTNIFQMIHFFKKNYISIMFKKVGEHIWRDLGPFLKAEPLKILHIFRFVLKTALFNSDHMFSINFVDFDFVFTELFLC